MSTRSVYSMVWLLSYISIASVSAAMLTPALPAIEKTFALSTGAVEWVVSFFLVGYVAGQLVYGLLANVYGRIKALQWGLHINIVGLVICFFASVFPHYFLLLLGRFITGLGSAAGLTCTFMLINEWLPPEKRKIAMAYSSLSFSLGIGFAVLLGGVITQYMQWQGCFVLLLLHGVLMRVGICVFQETLKEPKPLHIPTLLRDYGHALRSFPLFAFSSVWGVCSAVSYCYSAAAPQIAHQYLHLSASQYGYWNIFSIVGMLLGSFSARVLMLRFSALQVIMLGYAGSFFAFLNLVALLYLQNHSTLWFFLSVLVLYCCSVYFFAGGSYIASNAIEDKASAASMMSFINMAIATISVVVMGYISPYPFYSFLWAIAGIFFFTFLLVMRAMRYTLHA